MDQPSLTNFRGLNMLVFLLVIFNVFREVTCFQATSSLGPGIEAQVSLAISVPGPGQNRVGKPRFRPNEASWYVAFFCGNPVTRKLKSRGFFFSSASISPIPWFHFKKVLLKKSKTIYNLGKGALRWHSKYSLRFILLLPFRDFKLRRHFNMSVIIMVL